MTIRTSLLFRARFFYRFAWPPSIARASSFPLFLASMILLASCTPPDSPISSGSPGGSSGGKTITTIAGTGTPGAGGDNGPSTSAQLSSPCGIALDASGDLYIADYNNSKIRVVNTSQLISTFAGTGTNGYNSDGIAAASAELYWPTGVALDSFGSVYIADTWNSRIRKVTLTTSTVAGNGTPAFSGDGFAATLASISFPAGVCLDKSGNLYIADQTNHRVRFVSAASGDISTVAGSSTSGYSGDGFAATSASLTNPYAVVIDSSGNYYISDSTNNVIRRVDPQGIIHTFAGTGSAGYSGDGHAATSATLHNPTGLALDISGNLYIADSYNNVIRMVNTNGVISTVVGTGTAGFSPNGTAATSASLLIPQGVAVDSSGTLYIADSGNNVIREVK